MKEKINKIISALLIVVLLICAAPLSGIAGLDFLSIGANAKVIIDSGKCGDNVTYTLNYGNGLVTIEGEGEMYDFKFYYDEDIQNSPFYNNNNVVNVIIKEGVTSIGNSAFTGCKYLQSVDIAQSVTSIGQAAFKDCVSLESLHIPKNVKSIKSDTFRHCGALQSIVVDEGNEVYDSRENCNALIETKTDTLLLGSNNATIPNGIKKIKTKAFYNCSDLKAIDFPESLVDIDDYAFYGCSSLNGVRIPNGMTSVSSFAFSNCKSLENIYIPESVEVIYYRAFGGSSAKNLTVPCSTNIGGLSCSGLEHVTITKGTGEMINYSYTDSGPYMYYTYTPWQVSRTTIKEIILEDGITNIGSYAFCKSYYLPKIELPDTVTTIGEGGFYYCKRLADVKLSKRLVSIGKEAFFQCEALESIAIPESVKRIEERAFTGSILLDDVVLPYSVEYIGPSAFKNCGKLSKLTIYNRNCEIADSVVGENTVIYGYKFSTAATYAEKNNLSFVVIDDTHTHVYDSVCDKKCSLCGKERTAEGHHYDSLCDDSCSRCGETRIAPHNDKNNDEYCDDCGKYFPILAFDSKKTVSAGKGETVYMRFVAPYDGSYTFSSKVLGLDTYGYVYDSDSNLLTYDDNSGYEYNFSMTVQLEKDKTYFVGAKIFKSTLSGDITVTSKYNCEHKTTHFEHTKSTCKEHGYDRYICDICGYVVSETELPYGHKYTTSVVAPTCTEQGYIKHTCSLCGSSYNTDYTSALNHSHTTWQVSKNPTVNAEGLMIEVCDFCGIKLNEMVIPKLLPDYVTGITVSPNKLTLKIGESTNLTATVTPNTAVNKNVIWSSTEPDVASVDGETVTAKTPGVTVITAQTADGGYKDFCVVRVVGIVSKNGSVIDHENGLIYGIDCNSSDVNGVLELVDNTMEFSCDSDILGTGCVVNITKDGKIVDSYKTVVFGDVNGDGWYDGTDAMLVKCIVSGMIPQEKLSKDVLMAADCNHDGVINDLDVELLEKAGLLLSGVDQSKSQEELKNDSAYVEYENLIDQLSDSADTGSSGDKSDNKLSLEVFIEKFISIIKELISEIFALINK